MTDADKILQLLERKSYTELGIRQALKMTFKQIRAALKELREAGKVRKVVKHLVYWERIVSYD